MALLSLKGMGGTLVRVHKCRLQSAPLLDSGTDELKDRHATLDRKEDDENELMKDKPVEQDDSETEPSNDNVGEEDDGINNQVEIQDSSHRRESIKQQSITTKPGCRISYTEHIGNDNIQAKVLSRAGKASGSKRNWHNIKINIPSQLEGGELSVDLVNCQV